ncbi:MAG: NAD(P)-binding domain-containing protein [Deltaproteobacteria bacterium]
MNTRNLPKRVVIIGAGPAGVAAAGALSRRGVVYTLLEAGAEPLFALRRVDPQMRLLSPKRFSRLEEMDISSDCPDYPSMGEFIGLLEKYISAEGIRITTDTEVLKVIRLSSQFIVETVRGGNIAETLAASHVINATGIIRHPKLPDIFDSKRCSFRWKHSIDTRAEDLAGAKSVAVVGGGASAAEVLDLWLDVRGEGAEACICLRSRFRGFKNPIFGLDIHYWVSLPERIPSWILGWRAGRIPEPMNATRVLPAIKKGLIRLFPAPARYEGDSLTFPSGSRLKPDFVAFATGFDYGRAHLAGLLDYDPDGRPIVCCAQSTRTPGLYLLGFRFGRTFASPYIRGIARDAQYVASRIARESGHSARGSG